MQTGQAANSGRQRERDRGEKLKERGGRRRKKARRDEERSGRWTVDGRTRCATCVDAAEEDWKL